MSNWKLSNSDYHQLLSFVGTGDFRKSRIVFLGVEEGLDEMPVEPNVKARLSLENKQFLKKRDEWQDGYWCPSGYILGEHVRKELQALGEKPPKMVPPVGAFIQMSARICLALENPSLDVAHFFKAMNSGNPDTDERIRERMRYLFSPADEEIGTSLMDWRPLPKKNQDDWPVEYAHLDYKKYKRGFKTRRGTNADSFSNYTDDAKRRREIMVNVLRESPASVVVVYGGVAADCARMMFFDTEFHEQKFRGLQQRYFRGTKQIGGVTRHIFLLPHPGAWFAEGEGYALYQQFAEIIRPLFD